MLVLSRECGEEVVIGDVAVVVTIVEIRGDKVRLGFTADRSVPIHRREVYELVCARDTKPATKLGREND